ncbi:MAG: hypothetical protein ACK4LB_03555 [Spirosomataceae bacterium]
MYRFYSLFAGSLLLALTSCERSDVEKAPEGEFKHVRLLVSDQSTNQIHLITPQSGQVLPFQANHAGATLYGSESGRFGIVIHRTQNQTQTFDTGLEEHGDHVDIKGTPKWGLLVGNGALPTHFKTKGDRWMIFNDGDATLDWAYESDIHSKPTMQRINSQIRAHHGAMAPFSNGLIAITEKDGSVAGALPERVRIINASGQTVFASSVATRGIHGNATDGEVAVFGSSSGILVVNQNGTQRLISHPADFGTAWFGTIMETPQKGQFLGYTAARGVYWINTTTSTVTPLFESNDIMQCKLAKSGMTLAILTHAGELTAIDLTTRNRIASGSVIPATTRDETQKPQLESTGQFAYITQPKLGEIWQVQWNQLSKIQKIKTVSTPFRMAILGVESNEDH